MQKEKINQLLGERKSLDGEIHSLGFVFVKQTISDFKGNLQIESELGKGTKITVSIPCQPFKSLPSPRKSRCEKYRITQTENIIHGSSGLAKEDTIASKEGGSSNSAELKKTSTDIVKE